MTELYSILRNENPMRLPDRFKRVQLTRDGQPVPAGFFRSMLSTLHGGRRWIVQPDTPCRLRRRTIELIESPFDEIEYLDVTLEVEIPSKNFPEAVGKLTAAGDPALAIIDGYRRSVVDWFRGRALKDPGCHALESAARSRRDLLALAQRVGDSLGIRLRAHIEFDLDRFDPSSPEDEKLLKDVQVDIPEFSVSLSDYLAHEVLLALYLSLCRSGEVRAKPPRDEDGWRNLIRDLVRQETRRAISVRDYYDGEAVLGARLRIVIDAGIKPFGRAVRQLTARALSRLPVPSAQTVSLQIPWVGRPSGHTTVFSVSATMRVDPERPQVFVANGSPAYEAWLEQHARIALEAALVDADFVDLDQEYVGRLQDKLKVELAEAARRDGMRIAPFVARPKVPDIVNTRIARFNTGKRPYRTRDGSFEVFLEISASGSFKKLHHVVDLLPRDNQDDSPLQKRLTEIACEAAAQVLRGAYVDRYILRFGPFVDVEGREQVPPTEGDVAPSYLGDSIREKIKTDLERDLEFYCDINDVQLVQRDDRIADLMNMILGLKTFLIEVAIEPVDRRGDIHRLPAQIKYQVQTVNPDSILVVVRQNYTQEELQSDIREQIEIWTREVLSALPHELLRARKRELRENLKASLSREISRLAAKSFGAVVEVLSLEMHASEQERITEEQDALRFRLDRADLTYQLERLDDPDYREEIRQKLEWHDDSAYCEEGRRKQDSNESPQTSQALPRNCSRPDEEGSASGEEAKVQGREDRGFL
jgi:hypothetical protein